MLISMSVFAQNSVTALTYTISVPTEDTQKFIENESYLGIGFDAKTYVMDWLTVGGYIGWQVMYGQTDEVLEIEKGHVSGNQFRYINSFPLMLLSSNLMSNSKKKSPSIYILCIALSPLKCMSIYRCS